MDGTEVGRGRGGEGRGGMRGGRRQRHTAEQSLIIHQEEADGAGGIVTIRASGRGEAMVGLGLGAAGDAPAAARGTTRGDASPIRRLARSLTQPAVHVPCARLVLSPRGPGPGAWVEEPGLDGRDS